MRSSHDFVRRPRRARRGPGAEEGRAGSGQAVTADGELFERRDAAIGESLAVLTRKVKRALQDDQNIMLERLREVKAMITTELEDEHEQRARYADARSTPSRTAAAAGVQFAKDEAGVSGGRFESAALKDCAADLAVTIVLALRKENPHRRQWRRIRSRERRLQGVARGARRTSLYRRRATSL